MAANCRPQNFRTQAEPHSPWRAHPRPPSGRAKGPSRQRWEGEVRRLQALRSTIDNTFEEPRVPQHGDGDGHLRRRRVDAPQLGVRMIGMADQAVDLPYRLAVTDLLVELSRLDLANSGHA